MATLNDVAAEVMISVGIRAGTDITGFGLLGHLRSMLRSSGVAARVHASDVPILPGARSLAEAGHIPGGSRRNLQDLSEDISFADTLDEVSRTLLVDAQTSGGMLMSVPASQADALLDALEGRTPSAIVIGEVTEGPAGRIEVE